MKRIALIGLVFFGLAASVTRAQWTVYDPAVHSQQIMSSAQEIAKFVEVVNNQVSQIKTLTAQLDEFKHYVNLFGDPSSVMLETIKPLTDDLKKSEVGQTLAALQGAVDAGQALIYNAGGLFHSVGAEFTTPGGQTVKRQAPTYLPVAAVQKTTDNYLSVSTDVTARRVAIKAEIAKTTEALKAATTDAGVQKLTGVLVGLTAALESTGHEVTQATASAVVQDIANRADERRQIEAKKEQQHAEFAEAVGKYGKTFRLMNAPVKFPTR